MATPHTRAERSGWKRPASTSRRRFFGILAGSVTAGAALSGCDLIFGLPRDGGFDPNDPQNQVTLDFGSPVGILNYAYALEQLEAAFYTRVVSTPFAQINDEETRILTDLRDHEIAHREFFQAKIQELGGNPIAELSFNFDEVDFSSRQDVLQTAQDFEDLGVYAYNGAARFIEQVPPLMNAGEIVSVEARHAATIRDLLDPLLFAPDAFDKAFVPSEVLPLIQPFVLNRINVMNLPTGA